MGSELPRPVRISRGTAALDAAAAHAPAPETLDPYAPVSLPPHGNVGGLGRARRLVYLYLGVLGLLYVGVVLLVATSPYSAVRGDLALYIALSIIASVSALVGFVMTVGRAPFAVYVAGDDLVVRERFGGVRRFPLDETLRIDTRDEQTTSFLSPRPTEVVRVSSSRLRAREYVLEAGLLDGIPELSAHRGRR